MCFHSAMHNLVSFGVCIHMGHRMVLFLIFLRKLHTVFHNGCTNSAWRFLFFHILTNQHLLFLEFFILAILPGNGVMSHCSFDCISLVKSDTEPLFLCLLVTWMSPKIFCPFFNWTVFWVLSCISFLYILDTTP